LVRLDPSLKVPHLQTGVTALHKVMDVMRIDGMMWMGSGLIGRGEWEED
jgi:hypothetical protein